MNNLLVVFLQYSTHIVTKINFAYIYIIKLEQDMKLKYVALHKSVCW